MVGLGLPIFGGVLFFGGLFILIYLLLRVIKSLKEEADERTKPRKGARNVLLLLLALLLLICSRLCFWTGESLRSYQIYCPDKSAGRIMMETSENGASHLVYSFQDRKGKAYAHTVLVQGEKCQIEVEFLSWDPWLKDLGLVPAFKAVRVNFTSLEEPSVKTSEFPGGDNPFWEWIKKFDKPLFFVKTRLLKSNFIYLDFDQPQELLISGDKIVFRPENRAAVPDSTS